MVCLLGSPILTMDSAPASTRTDHEKILSSTSNTVYLMRPEIRYRSDV